MHMITDTAALAALCTRLREERYVTVDTEFIRDSTYWPRLCLVQIAGAGDEAIVDPLAEGIALDPLFELMSAPAVLKVFHAARQDIEIFHYLGRVIPDPLFDSQVAAMVCGFGDSVGYETLVRRLTGGSVDKSSRFTDWSRRPLSDKQLAYAISDVTHLRPIFETLEAQLEERGRAHWLKEEMAVLQAPETYAMDPDKAWLRIKSRNSNRRFRACLKEIAAWREREAQTRNQPRGRVLKDDALLEIAANMPKTVEDLDRLRGVPKGFARSRAAKDLIEAVARARALPDSELPAAPKQRSPVEANAATVELLRVLLKLKCEAHEVAQKLIANAADLEAIALDDEADVPALKGWRRDLFGEDALALKRGEVALAVKGDQTVVVPVGAAVSR